MSGTLRPDRFRVGDIGAVADSCYGRRRGNALFGKTMISWAINHSILLLIYASFVVSGGCYLKGVHTYQGVESWPSVEAKIVGSGGDVVSVSTPSRYDFTSTTTIDSRFVEFQYSVGGNSFRSISVTPDGGYLFSNSRNEPLRAFYNPSSPDIAVLTPVPFRGTGLLITAGFTGILVAAHLWFTIPAVIAKKLRAEPGAVGQPANRPLSNDPHNSNP